MTGGATAVREHNEALMPRVIEVMNSVYNLTQKLYEDYDILDLPWSVTGSDEVTLEGEVLVDVMGGEGGWGGLLNMCDEVIMRCRNRCLAMLRPFMSEFVLDSAVFVPWSWMSGWVSEWVMWICPFSHHIQKINIHNITKLEFNSCSILPLNHNFHTTITSSLTHAYSTSWLTCLPFHHEINKWWKINISY